MILFIGYFSVPKTIKEDGLERKSDAFLYNENNIDKLMNSTVALVGPNLETGELESYCSGFFIGPRTIVTAKHCIFSADGEMINENDMDFDYRLLTVLILDRKTFEDNSFEISEIQLKHLKEASIAKVNTNYFVDYSKDHLILELAKDEAPNRNWLAIARTDLKVADSVYTVGMPLNFPWVFVSGRFAQKLNMKDVDRFTKQNLTSMVIRSNLLERKFYLLNMNVWPGASGGPIVNNNGEVVGLVSMNVYIESAGGGLVVSPDSRCLRSFVDGFDESYGSKLTNWFKENLSL
jgi:S1-C subfamily serine protease